MSKITRNIRNFGGGGAATPYVIAYQRPIQLSVKGQTAWNLNDAQAMANDGRLDYPPAPAGATMAELDINATEADVRSGTFYGSPNDGTASVYSTVLTKNNIHGNKFRFTDSLGNPSDSSASDIWAHVDWVNHSFTGALMNYVEDHLTGLATIIINIKDGTKYSQESDVAKGQDWDAWVNYVAGMTTLGFSDWRVLTLSLIHISEPTRPY